MRRWSTENGRQTSRSCCCGFTTRKETSGWRSLGFCSGMCKDRLDLIILSKTIITHGCENPCAESIVSSPVSSRMSSSPSNPLLLIASCRPPSCTVVSTRTPSMIVWVTALPRSTQEPDSCHGARPGAHGKGCSSDARTHLHGAKIQPQVQSTHQQD